MLGIGSLNSVAGDRLSSSQRLGIAADHLPAMAARTPRKRKHSPATGDGHWSYFGTPVKKLLVDCSVVLTPLQPRNSNRSNIMKRSPTPAYTAMEDPKENFGASPVKSSVARKLLVSPPPQEDTENDAYAFPPLKSPTSGQKAAVTTKSFYKKGALYVSLLDRKLISETKSKGGMAFSPPTSNGTKSKGGMVFSPPTSNGTKSKGGMVFSPPTSNGTKSKGGMVFSPPTSNGTKSKGGMVFSPPTSNGTKSKDGMVFSPPTSNGTKSKDGMVFSPPTSNGTKSKDGMVSPPTRNRAKNPGMKKSSKLIKTKKPPSQKKRASTRRLSSHKSEKKVEEKESSPPAPVTTESRVPSPQKSAILGLKIKQRPKLTMGAAFFATSKRPHSSRKLPAHIKFPANSKPKPLTPSGTTGTGPLPDSGEKVTKERMSSEGEKKAESIRTVDAKKDGKPKSDTVLVPKPPEVTKPSGPSRQNHTEPQADTRHHSTFDMNDSILKASDKKVSSVYPIFSTPSAGKKRPFDLRADLASPVCASTPVSTPALINKVPKPSKKKDAKMDGDQLIIDAGQKHFGPVVCSTCGMIYSAASLEDETQHAQYHQRLLESIRYVGWKKERVVAEFWDGKILMICPDDPKYALRKAEEVRELVDSELGFQQTHLISPSKTKTYLFVSNDRKIVGCLIAESIRQGFRVIPEPFAVAEPLNQDALERHRAWRCSSEPEPAICGVSRIWVFALMRRKAIASRLVDAMRNSFIYGCHLTTEEIAFSDPTPDGKLFASTYCKLPDFLVYNFLT